MAHGGEAGRRGGPRADRLCRYGEGGNLTASANTFQSVTAYQSNPDGFELRFSL